MHLAGQLFATPGHTFTRACRDLSVETPIGRWNMIEAQPAPDLVDVVDCYWEGWGDIPPMREKILPRTNIELMFNLKGEHRVLSMDGQDCNMNYGGGWLSGLQRRWLLIETTHGSHFVAARLKPWGTWRLLRTPMNEIACRVPETADLWGGNGQLLHERLVEAPNCFARFDLLEADLRARLDLRARQDETLVEASRRIRRSLGRQRIDSLCRELGTTRGTLGRHFREQVGLTPKTYARVVRIEALMAHLGASAPDSWAAVAEDFGYHDQAHLAHDFREFCGATPEEYLRRASPGGGATMEDW